MSNIFEKPDKETRYTNKIFRMLEPYIGRPKKLWTSEDKLAVRRLIDNVLNTIRESGEE